MGNRNVTRRHNASVLEEAGFSQVTNTTVYHRGKTSLISPAVAANNNGGYWFDIRRVNLDRLGKNSYLLIRIVPDMFVCTAIENIKRFLSPELMGRRPHSGDVWALGLDFNPEKMTARLFNKSRRSETLNVELLDLNSVKHLITDM